MAGLSIRLASGRVGVATLIRPLLFPGSPIDPTPYILHPVYTRDKPPA